MFKVALKNILAHKFRSLALLVTVVLGVSFVAGTYVLTDTITRVFNDIFSEAYSAVDVNVRTVSELGTDAAREPVPASLLATVESVPGVQDAEGGIFDIGADIVDAEGSRVGNKMAPTFGLSWAANDQLSPLELRAGHKPTGPDQVAIDARSFDDGHFHLGDTVQIVTPTGPHTFTLVGVAGFGRASNIAGATLAMWDLPTAQQMMNRVGVYDSIDVKAEPGVSPDVLQERISQVLPKGTEAVTAERLTTESNDAVDKGLGFFKTFLLIFAFVALFVGAFIIYNTFGIVVSQRTRELALLRALGATGRQVMTSVIAESVLLGFVASVIGLGAGVLLAAGLKAVLAGFGFDVPSGSMVILSRTVLVALIGGTLITTISAIAPAVRASRVPPIAAMSDVAVSHRGTAIRRNIVGVVLGVGGVVLVLWGLGEGTLPVIGVGALMTFVGVAMLAPLFARPVARVAGRPIAQTRGVAGMLARQNAMRSARRTAATASALMIGTALMAGSLILSRSTTSSIDRAVSAGVHSDLIVSTDNQVGFSPTLADQVQSIPGVQYVASFRVGRIKIGDATKSITGFPAAAMDPSSPQYAFDVDVREGDTARLGDDTIALRRKTAEDHGWKLGQDVTVTFPSGPQVLRIVALYDRNTLAGDYLVGLDTFERNFADQSDFLVSLRLAPGTDLRTVQASVQQLVDTSYPGLKVQDRAQYSADVKGRINQFLGLITALLALAILIALLGVLITMLLAVYERTRELGLLRAVGMARRQMRSMVRWEAAIVAAYGAVLGLLLGLFFGLALTTALHDQGVTERVVPIALLVLLAVIIAVLGVVAAIYPARRAARLNILEAIAQQ